MENQKLENILNLSLDATQEEREKSSELNIGYNEETRTWELIVKYSGSLDGARELGAQVEELLNEYAIIVIPESQIERLSRLPEIEYIEKPKRLFFAVNQAKAASCINPVQGGILNLSGKGVIIAVIDSGIDYYHDDFRNEDGSSRILLLWDQTLDRVFTREEINSALALGSRAAALREVPSVDSSGHGTAVAGIAAGNGRESNGRYRGVAYESDLIVVKLGIQRPDGFPRTTELMRALNFVVKASVERLTPIAVNISFGNTYGSHDGTSLIETFINDISNYGRTTVVIGTGNEGNAGGHQMGILEDGVVKDVEFSIAPYETGLSIQLWKSYADIFDISIITPSNEIVGPISSRIGPQTISFFDVKILLYYGKPSPYSMAQEIYMDFIPTGDYIESGIWKIRFTPGRIIDGRYDLWMPSSNVLNSSTRFLESSPDTTLTIPSASAMAISVGAYDDSFQTYADFSGRGYTRRTNQVKPDISAPGVNILTSSSGGGYEAVTGTSFATPFVTGSAALMMEWGIIDGNDLFLYGEKVKAYLIRGARHLPGFESWPNPLLGYGALCVRDSLPG